MSRNIVKQPESQKVSSDGYKTNEQKAILQEAELYFINLFSVKAKRLGKSVELDFGECSDQKLDDIHNRMISFMNNHDEVQCVFSEKEHETRYILIVRAI